MSGADADRLQLALTDGSNSLLQQSQRPRQNSDRQSGYDARHGGTREHQDGGLSGIKRVVVNVPIDAK